jgi:hypothetical protein
VDPASFDDFDRPMGIGALRVADPANTAKAATAVDQSAASGNANPTAIQEPCHAMAQIRLHELQVFLDESARESPQQQWISTLVRNRL